MPDKKTTARLERKLRVGKKRAVYLPAEFLEILGLSIGDVIIARIEDNRIVIERPTDPLLLAAKRKKWSSTTVDEFEEESEIEQDSW